MRQPGGAEHGYEVSFSPSSPEAGLERRSIPEAANSPRRRQALLHRRKQAKLSAVLPQSDGVDEFCEDRCERISSIDVRAEFVVAPMETSYACLALITRVVRSGFRLRIGRSRAFKRP